MVIIVHGLINQVFDSQSVLTANGVMTKSP